MMICITFMNAQKDTEKIICLVNLCSTFSYNIYSKLFP